MTKLVFFAEEYGNPYTAIFSEKQNQGRGEILFVARLLAMTLYKASKRDYYDVLGVPKTASDEDVKRAFQCFGAQAPPGQRRAGKSEVQGVNKGIQGALGQGEAREVPNRFPGTG